MRQRFPYLPVTLALLLSAATEARAEYIVTDLGTLGGSYVTPYGINNNGQVVGDSNNHAFLYSAGKMTDLGTLGGGSSSAFGINDAGQVVGVSQVGAQVGGYLGIESHAFLYQGGTMTDLGTAGNAPGSMSAANAINASGQVVGTSWVPPSDPHGYLTTGAKLTDLGPFDPVAINASGQAAGSALNGNGAAVYSGGKVTELGTLGGSQSWATGINSAGQVVGYSYTKDGLPHAFLYSGGKMTDLGTLGGGQSWASGINDAGQVVGEALTQNGSKHAFLFSDGKMTDLNSLIPADSGWILDRATAINNKGQIVGTGSGTRAFLLTPVPEPGSVVLLGIGALGLAGHAWRKRRRPTARRPGAVAEIRVDQCEPPRHNTPPAAHRVPTVSEEARHGEAMGSGPGESGPALRRGATGAGGVPYHRPGHPRRVAL